jgi:hypothetical protein
MAFFNRLHPNAQPTRPEGSAHGLNIEPIWFEWLALGGLLLFGSWLLGMRGVWALLLSSDPTGITLVIIVVFVASTLWCGARSRELQRQRRLLVTAAGDGWAAEYLAALRARPADDNAPLDLLIEMAQAPHHTAWWVNGIQLKLGLLGKVIGFSVLALQIGNIQSFDASQSQDLLKSLTQGLGIALLTTMVGLVGNILLGLQLTRLDRFADAFVADCQRAGLRIGPPPDAPAAPPPQGGGPSGPAKPDPRRPLAEH